jgi:hypothetical protein
MNAALFNYLLEILETEPDFDKAWQLITEASDQAFDMIRLD